MVFFVTNFRKWCLLLFCLIPFFTYAQNLQKQIDQLLERDFYKNATTGIFVYDLTDNKPLYQKDEKKLCRPASNMKLLTSASALLYLKPEYEFITKLYYTGIIDTEGILLGDLYLEGGFDPELMSADLDFLIQSLSKIGIKKINGSLFIDVSMADSIHWGKAWSWDDDKEAFQPYISPLPINRDIVKLKVIPASPSQNPIIKTEPETSFIRIVNEATTEWKSQLPAKKSLIFDRKLDGNLNLIRISGTISSSSSAYQTMISLQNPNGYVLALFAESITQNYPSSVLQSSGVRQVPSDAYFAGSIAHTLPDVIRKLNKDSENLNAEMLLYAMGYQCGNKPATTESGITMLQQTITQVGLNPERYKIVDGSGLSNQNYLSPELLVSVLKHMYASPYYGIFKESLPIAGIDGTLANRMKNTTANQRVFAKTGSLTGVSTLSGYVKTRNGHWLAFSIMIQNFVEKTSDVTIYLDKICEILADS